MRAHLALLCDVGQVVAEAAQQAPVALVAQVVEADALLLAVELHNGGDVVRVLALVAAGAQALGEVEADLRVADVAVAGARRGVFRGAVLHARMGGGSARRGGHGVSAQQWEGRTPASTAGHAWSSGCRWSAAVTHMSRTLASRCVVPLLTWEAKLLLLLLLTTWPQAGSSLSCWASACSAAAAALLVRPAHNMDTGQGGCRCIFCVPSLHHAAVLGLAQTAGTCAVADGWWHAALPLQDNAAAGVSCSCVLCVPALSLCSPARAMLLRAPPPVSLVGVLSADLQASAAGPSVAPWSRAAFVSCAERSSTSRTISTHVGPCSQGVSPGTGRC